MSGIEVVQNAVITAATISTAGHGILSAWLSLDYGGTCQGFGGAALFVPERHSANYAGLWLWRVMEVAGVEEWSKLVGKTIRARGSWGGVSAIGHIVKDDWFEPAVEFARLRGEP